MSLSKSAASHQYNNFEFGPVVYEFIVYKRKNLSSL